MKVSEITVDELIDYINLDETTEEEKKTLSNMLEVAKTFIKSYTGVKDLDKYDDFTIVVKVLVQDMWDNRTLYVDKNNINMVVETILGMHSENLL